LVQNPQEEILIIVYAVNYIIILDNLKSHKGADAKAEARRPGIGLVSLPPYFPN
jgi:transposase